MEKRPSRIELIKILLQDRNHHFTHPHDVAIKHFYALGGTITTLSVALFVKSEISDVKELISKEPVVFGLLGILIIIGYTLIIWGLAEHSTIHNNQRKRIESAIEYLVMAKPETYEFDKFWQRYGNLELKYNQRKKSKVATKLIVAEPDVRGWFHFHDRKIELGILMILIGTFGILTTLFL